MEEKFLLALTPGAKEYFELMNRIVVTVSNVSHGDSYAEPSSYGVSFFDPITGNRGSVGMKGRGGYSGIPLFMYLPKSFLSEEGVIKRGEFFDILFGKQGTGKPSL